MFLPDTAITSVEHDRLGRAEFAKRLGETLCGWDREESIVIALYGPWGSGKSSVLNMAIKHIEETIADFPEEQRPIIVRFNPWNFSGQNHLLITFFMQLFAHIRTGAPGFADQIKGKLATFGKILSITSSIPGVGQVPVVGTLVAPVGELLQLFNEEQSVDDLKRELNDAFRAHRRRVIIAMDDIDRLTQPEIRQLFRMIKLNTDFPNTVYVIAADRAVVEKSLSTEQGISGRDYLEKIVQVGFDIPAVDPERISSLLREELQRVRHTLPDTALWDDHRFEELYHSGFRGLFDTVRDVKRFINGLSFNISVVSAEVNPVDFIGIEALRIFLPEVYEGIRTRKNLFVAGVAAGLVESEQIRAQYEDIFKGAGEQDAIVIARNICLQLFPAMHRPYRNMYYSRDHHMMWRRERRICAPAAFDVYFLLGTPQGAISQAQLRQIISASEDKAQLTTSVGAFIDAGQYRSLLDWLGDIIDDLSEAGIRNLASVLLELYNKLPDERSGLFDIGTDLLAVLLVHQALARFQADQRCLWIRQQITEHGHVSSAVLLVNAEADSNKRKALEPLLAPECVEALKAVLVQKCAEEAAAGRLLGIKQLRFVLIKWREWASDEAPIQAFVEQSLKSPTDALRFLEGFLWQGDSHVFGEYTSTPQWQIDLETLRKFVAPERLAEVLASITEEEAAAVSERRRVALIAFRNTMEHQAQQPPDDALTKEAGPDIGV